jgi:mutator protein MutT
LLTGTPAERITGTRHDRYPVAAHLILRNTHGGVLLMRRAGSAYGVGRLAFPAGHVDHGETPTASIIREAREEIGITITPDGLTPAGVMFRRSSQAYVDFFFTATTWNGTPRICEPHKCTELTWADPGALPADALDYIGPAIANMTAGRHFSEHGWNASDATNAP